MGLLRHFYVLPQKLQIRLAAICGHGRLTLGPPVLELIYNDRHCMAVTTAPILQSLVTNFAVTGMTHQGWLVVCLMSQKHVSVPQGRISTDNFTCCHTEIQVADQTFYLTQSQYSDTRLTSPSADPTMPGAWQGSHWTRKNPKQDLNPGSSAPKADALTTRPARQ